jgi:hypothetical protein
VARLAGVGAEPDLDLRRHPLHQSRRVVFPIVDMVSRKWIDTLVSVEETATQVEVIFERAVEIGGLLELLTDERLDLAVDDPNRPILLAVSDNVMAAKISGPCDESGPSTRIFDGPIRA